MGTASRKTWLEKQSDEVQFDVLNWDDSGRMTLEAMVEGLHRNYGLTVPVSTLHNSLQVMHHDGGVRLVRLMNAFFRQHPEADSHVLSRAYVLAQAASEEFRKAKLEPNEVVKSAQRDKRLSIAQRELAIKEERNRLAKEEVGLERRRVELLERKLPKVQEVVERAINEKASPVEIRRRIREIFGIADPESAEKHRSGAGLSGAVDPR